MLADMAVGVKTKYDRTPFVANRFSNKNSSSHEMNDEKILSKIWENAVGIKNVLLCIIWKFMKEA